MLHGAHRLHRTSANLTSLLRSQRTAWSRRSYVNNATSEPSIAVLGGGITGLATAYYITQRLPRAKVTLFEASDRIGGWLLSNRVPVSGGSVLFEAGPRSLRTAGNGILAARLIDELELKDDTIFTPTSSPAASHRYLYYPDHLVCMPHPRLGLIDGLATILREPLFTGVLSGIFMEPFQKVRDEKLQDESIGDFLARRFGRPVVDNIVSAVLHGIYAGDVYSLSARSLFPRLWRGEVEYDGLLASAVLANRSGVEMSTRDVAFFQEAGKVKDLNLMETLRRTSVFTFRDGIGMLVDRLARRLWASGSTEVRTATRVDSLRLAEDGQGVDVSIKGESDTQRFSHVVSALSPAHLNSLMGTTTSRIPDIPAVTVMTVNLFFRDRERIPPGPGADSLGFGYLIPRATPFENNPERALGVVFDHAYSLPKISSHDTSEQATIAQDDLAQEGTKVTVMLGGHWWNDWPSYPDEQEGLQMARAVLQRHLGITQEPEAYQVNLQQDCIPQYIVGHEDRLKSAHNSLAQAYKGRVRVAGSWVGGVGVNDCLRSAWDVVQGLERGTDGTGLEHIGAEQFVKMKLQARTSNDK